MFFCPSQPSQPIILSCINTLIPYNMKGVKGKKREKQAIMIQTCFYEIACKPRSLLLYLTILIE